MFYENRFAIQVKTQSKAEGLRVAGLLCSPEKIVLVEKDVDKKTRTCLFEIETAWDEVYLKGYLTKNNIICEGIYPVSTSKLRSKPKKAAE